MKLKALTAIPLALALVGCGGGSDVPELSDEQKRQNDALEKAAAEYQPGETVVNPNLEKQDGGGDAPPPAAGDAAPAAESAMNSDLAGFDAPDSNSGAEKTVLEALNLAVENYDRMRNVSVVEPNQKGWPELKTIDDLVKYRVIRRLPPAPDGKKWHLNTENMTVELK